MIYIHDADGTGNSDGNGYHHLGFDANTGDEVLTVPITGAYNRDQIDQVKIRIYTSFFGGESINNARQRTHVWYIRASGTANNPTVSSSSYLGNVITKTSHDYAPSVMIENGVYKMWWCSVDLVDLNGDAIWYATSTNGINWSSPTQVLRGTANSAESQGLTEWGGDSHTCDPSVVKVGNTYYMYYTAAFAPKLPPNTPPDPRNGKNNQIFLARSSNGVNWTKYPNDTSPQPRISFAPAATNPYGVGQSSVFYLNGKFYQYYSYIPGGPGTEQTRLKFSYDGINWYNHNSNNTPMFYTSGFNMTYLWNYNVFMAIRVAPDANYPNGRIDYVFSYDGISWSPTVQRISAGNTRSGYIVEAGITTGPYGLYGLPTMRLYYAAGSQPAETWDLDRTDINLTP